MRYEPQGLERWANADPSRHCNTIEPVDGSWRNKYLELLKARDYEAAEMVRRVNGGSNKGEPRATS